MALIKHKYTKKELKDLGPPFRLQIGSDTHILRAIKPKIAEEFFERIQKKVTPVLIMIKRTRTKARQTARNIFIPCSPLVGRL